LAIFGRVFNNIRPASSLDNGSNYHLFKAGVRPEWEDKANENGGKWVLQFKPMQKRELDKAWLYLVKSPLC
jgi:translation initiation factor 4E